MSPADSFIPDGAFGREIAATVLARLAESVHDIEVALSATEDARQFSVSRMQGEAIASLPALACAAYFDVLDAVLDDDVGLALERLKKFNLQASAPKPPFLRSWQYLSAGDQRDIMRHVNADPSTRVEFMSPAQDSCERAETAIRQALDLFDRAAPEISAEIRPIIREIILVAGTVNDGERFDGATAFRIWGALFLNADEHGSRIEAVDGLSHESAHALLLGRSLGLPLVENEPEERFPSPLRCDPRPLDGIYHATFVSARMHYAHHRMLAASHLLTDDERSVSRQRLAETRSAFDDGHATLVKHARLTPLGEQLLEGALAYMGTGL